jgi:hypothetical protein
MIWRLGRPELATWFRNEKQLTPQEAAVEIAKLQERADSATSGGADTNKLGDAREETTEESASEPVG